MHYLFTCIFIAILGLVLCDAPSYSFVISHTSDVHGYIGGHPHEDGLNAQLPDYISYVEHLRETQKLEGRSVLVMDSGDLSQGTGYSDADTPAGKFVWDAYSHLQLDGIPLGNHDLGIDGLAPWIQDNAEMLQGGLITTNVKYGDHYIGNQYRMVHLEESGLHALLFGFVYTSFGTPIDGVDILPINDAFDVIRDQLNQLTPKPDVIIPLVHIALEDGDSANGDMAKILTQIRNLDDHQTTPVIFLTGHSHRWVQDDICVDVDGDHDAFCMRAEPGCYLRKIAQFQVDLEPRADGQGFQFKNGNKPDHFPDRYGIDMNVDVLKKLSTYEGDWLTPNARTVQKKMAAFAKKHELFDVIGCAPHDYEFRGFYRHETSVANLFIFDMFNNYATPKAIKQGLFDPKCNVSDQSVDQEAFLVLNDGFVRNAIYEGDITMDSMFEVMPFPDPLIYFNCVPGSLIRDFLGENNAYYENPPTSGSHSNPKWLPSLLPRELDDSSLYAFVMSHYVYERSVSNLKRIWNDHLQTTLPATKQFLTENSIEMFVDFIESQMVCEVDSDIYDRYWSGTNPGHDFIFVLIILIIDAIIFCVLYDHALRQNRGYGLRLSDFKISNLWKSDDSVPRGERNHGSKPSSLEYQPNVTQEQELGDDVELN